MDFSVSFIKRLQSSQQRNTDRVFPPFSWLPVLQVYLYLTYNWVAKREATATPGTMKEFLGFQPEALGATAQKVSSECSEKKRRWMQCFFSRWPKTAAYALLISKQ